MSLQTFEFTLVGQHNSGEEVTSEHYSYEAHCEADAIREVIREEELTHSCSPNWELLCVIRGHVELCWAKDQ